MNIRHRWQVAGGRRGQSAVEYMVVTAAIVGAVVVLGAPGGPLRAAWDRLVNGAVDKINQVAP